eukprot:Seg725.3 transcript_id=Seg725.3/GoldUCD/mRNA.D3Y31 product="hypothetical protein" protein_id=Seg725.3/GoldUCD/D3Y31
MSREHLIYAYCKIIKLQGIKSSIFAKFNSVSRRQLCNTLLINAANCSIELGSAQHCIDILDTLALQEGDIINIHHFICANSLTSSAFACQGNFTAAPEKAELCCDTLAAKLPGNHNILAIAFNRLGVILAASKKFEVAILNFERALDIIKKTVGQKSIQNAPTRFNKFLAECVRANEIEQAQLKKHIETIHSLPVM